MRSYRLGMLVVRGAVLLAASSAVMAAKNASPAAPTIGDLNAKTVEISPAPVKSGGASRAMRTIVSSCCCRTAIRAYGPRQCGGSGT
jgi:hypothetical protein